MPRGRLAPALVLLTACASAGPPPPPPSLAYDAGATSPAAVYLKGDTSRLELDAAGQTIEVDVASSSTLDVAFRPAAGGLEVTAVFRDFSGRASNPMGADQTATGEVVHGPLVFVLDPRGAPSLVSEPELDDAAARFLIPEAVAATLFPRLPARVVHPGDSWTDTVSVEADQPDGSVGGTSVVTYTVVGDTVVDAARLLRVDQRSDDARDLTARQAGAEITQHLNGSSEGWFLWDLRRGLLHESVQHSELTGTMEVAAAPFPLAIRLVSSTQVRLAGEAEGG